MKRTVLNPDWGVSTCCEVDNLVFIGHHAGHTKDGNKLFTIEEQTEETFRNLKTTLDTIDLTFGDIVSVNVLLRNISDFNGMHSIWQKWFPNEYPCRTTLTTDFVDAHCLIQVNAVAYRTHEA